MGTSKPKDISMIARIGLYRQCLMEEILNINTESLKIPKGQSEAVNWMTDNSIDKRKREKNNDIQNITQKLKIEQDEPH